MRGLQKGGRKAAQGDLILCDTCHEKRSDGQHTKSAMLYQCNTCKKSFRRYVAETSIYQNQRNVKELGPWIVNSKRNLDPFKLMQQQQQQVQQQL